MCCRRVMRVRIVRNRWQWVDARGNWLHYRLTVGCMASMMAAVKRWLFASGKFGSDER